MLKMTVIQSKNEREGIYMIKNASTKVITGKDTRFSYCSVWEPKSINGGDPRYSVSLLIPKTDKDTVGKINAVLPIS